MPAPDERLTAVLRCPATHGELRALGPDEVRAANRRIAAGEAFRCDGTPVGRPLVSALASLDGSRVYPVEDGVIVLLKDLAIQGAGDGCEGASPSGAPGGRDGASGQGRTRTLSAPLSAARPSAASASSRE